MPLKRRKGALFLPDPPFYKPVENSGNISTGLIFIELIPKAKYFGMFCNELSVDQECSVGSGNKKQRSVLIYLGEQFHLLRKWKRYFVKH